MKTAIVILSDPKAGAEEAWDECSMPSPCAELATGRQCVVFAAGTRWPAELTKLTHRHTPHQSVRCGSGASAPVPRFRATDGVCPGRQTVTITLSGTRPLEPPAIPGRRMACGGVLRERWTPACNAVGLRAG
jgi:hypothetical protein